MSSEGTLSDVVGEDVMPLAYMGMDEESSPSSSERTGEEVGEGEDIPVNVLVNNEMDRCYNPDLGIVSQVKGYRSELSSRGSLRHLPCNCSLPSHVLIRPVEVNERVCSAPRDHWMPMYVHYLAAGLRFPIPELLVGLLLDYSIGITQLTPNAVRMIIGFIVYCRARGVGVPTVSMFKHFFLIKSGGKSERGWYYFGPRMSSKGNRSLFTAGLSSIKGWKEKFFFVDDTEWSRREAKVEYLSTWKVKKAKQNEYKLNEDEVEEVGKLVREEGDLVDILYLTSSEAIEAAELYGPSSLSEGVCMLVVVCFCVRFLVFAFNARVVFSAKMDRFFSAAGAVPIPKKPRRKSKTSTVAGEGVPEKETASSTSVRALEAQPRPELKRKVSEEVSEDVPPLKRKKKALLEEVARGDEVVEFVPRPPPVEVEPEVRASEEAEVRGPGKGKS
ncbi:hypothetical protein SLA2020_018090 [Shorea laevis]